MINFGGTVPGDGKDWVGGRGGGGGSGVRVLVQTDRSGCSGEAGAEGDDGQIEVGVRYLEVVAAPSGRDETWLIEVGRIDCVGWRVEGCRVGTELWCPPLGQPSPPPLSARFAVSLCFGPFTS